MQAERSVVGTSGEQGGGKPLEKLGSGKPGRAHEKEKPVVPSKRDLNPARKHQSMAEKSGRTVTKTGEEDTAMGNTNALEKSHRNHR